VDFGLLDADGDLIGLPYHYRDQRTEGMEEEALLRLPREQIFDITGVAFQPFNTLFQLLATRRTKPRDLDTAATLLFMPDLLAYFLTGEKGTEYTDASTGQLLDARTRSWSTELLRSMDLPGSIFTPINNPGIIRGRLLPSLAVDLQTGNVPVIAVASHDTASAVVAVPARDQLSAYLSSGTWSLLGVEVDEPVMSPDALRWNFTNEGGFGGKIRLLHNVMGLWLLQESRRRWEMEGNATGFDDLVRAAGAAAPFAAQIDPDDPSFYAPGDMPSRIRGFCARTGQKIPESQGAIVRTVLESLALKYRWVVERLEQITGRRVNVLYIVGGGARNSLLNQFTANALGRPVVGGFPEATAAGNVLVQAFALGALRDIREMREVMLRSFEHPAYTPHDAAAWDDAYGRFLRLLPPG
jgi:sugar (pentulose or hexulose) kinase